MALKGSFSWYVSLHQGGRKAISFTLTNTNLLMSETVDVAIVDGSNQIPTKFYYGLKLSAGKSMVFNADNGAWDWAQGDFFAIIDKDKKIVERWDLNLPMLASGECKECRGSHKCGHCNGNGRILNRYIHAYEVCQVCRGTGICQTCFVPTRQNSPNSPNYVTPSASSQIGSSKHEANIRSRIQELEHKVYILEQENLNLQRNGQELSLKSIYQNNLQLMHSYRREILKLQNLLNSI